jgi:hypothetical protein
MKEQVTEAKVEYYNKMLSTFKEMFPEAVRMEKREFPYGRVTIDYIIRDKLGNHTPYSMRETFTKTLFGKTIISKSLQISRMGENGTVNLLESSFKNGTPEDKYKSGYSSIAIHPEIEKILGIK